MDRKHGRGTWRYFLAGFLGFALVGSGLPVCAEDLGMGDVEEADAWEDWDLGGTAAFDGDGWDTSLEGDLPVGQDEAEVFPQEVGEMPAMVAEEGSGFTDQPVLPQELPVGAGSEAVPGKEYAVTITPSEGGTLLADKERAVAGGVVALKSKAKGGYGLSSIRCTYTMGGVECNLPVSEDGQGGYCIEMPSADVTIVAEWLAVGTWVSIDAVSGSFQDKIKLNYYFSAPKGVTIPEEAYVVLAAMDPESEIDPLTISFAQADLGNGSYRFSIPLCAHDASETVTALAYLPDGRQLPIYDSDGAEYMAGISSSLMSYFEWLSSSGEEEDRALGMAAKDYCIAAQLYFDYHVTEGMAVSGAVTQVSLSDLEPYAIRMEGSPGAVQPRGITALIEADNKLNLYLTGDVEGDHTYRIDGTPVEAKTRESDGSKYLCLEEGVLASQLQQAHTYWLDDYQVTASVLSFARQIVAYGKEEKEINLGKALYLYNQAALAKFAE